MVRAPVAALTVHTPVVVELYTTEPTDPGVVVAATEWVPALSP
jgi:hypothetical protein